MSKPQIPESMEASGLMVDSRYLGNGLRFDPEALAEMANRMVGYPFVINHNMGVEAISGVVVAASAETYEFDFEHTVDGELKTTTRQAARIERTVSLNDSFPAYEVAAGSILALDAAGAMPNTSMAISATNIRRNEFEEFELVGPYRFIHDSHVSTGAFSHNEGVGLRDLQFNAGETMLRIAESKDEARSLPATFGFKVVNLEDLVVSFTEANLSSNPELVAKLGAALGMEAAGDDTPAEVSGSGNTVTLTQTITLSTPNVEGEDDKLSVEAGAGLNIDPTTDEVETMRSDDHVPNEAPTLGEAPTSEAAAKAGASEDVVNREDFDALKLRFEAMEAEKIAAEKAAFDAKVAELTARHPELEEKLGAIETEAQLSLVAELAGRKANPLPPETFRMKSEVTDESVKGSAAQARKWHEERLAKMGVN